MKILFIRHGQSTGNVSGRFTGQTDVKLTELGITQSQILCDYILKNYKVDKIYSSFLSRAIDTVKPLTQSLNLDIICDTKLNELSVGDWENMLISDINKDYPEEIKKWESGDVYARCPNGENFYEVYHRAVSFLTEILSDDNSTVVISSHGGIIRSLLCFIKYGSVEKLKDVSWGSNASITEVHYKDKKFSLIREFYDEFLGDLTSTYVKTV
jgi:alpha-ribazole phosphatase